MPIIDFASASQLQEGIQAASQAVSGMSAAEASAALGGTQVGASGFAQIHTFPFPGGGNYKPVSLEAQYATQTWNYYKIAAQAAGITSFGAAAAAARTWASGVLFGTGQGTLAATGGLLTLSAPAAVAAAAPLLGVGIGASLYNANPELWTKISQAILPWCYKDTQTVPAAVDVNGQVSIAKGFVEALKSVFDEEKIGPDYGGIDISGTGATGALTPYTAPVGVSFLGTHPTLGNKYIRVWGNSPVYVTYTQSNDIYASPISGSSVGLRWGSPNNINAQFRLTSSYTRNGQTVYYASSTSSWSEDQYLSGASTISGMSVRDIAWYSVYGSLAGEYQEGTSEWTGTTPTVLPEIPVIVIIEDPETGLPAEIPYTPIQLPDVNPSLPVPVEPDPDAPLPWESPDPEEDPSKSDPQAPTPWPQIGPWIDPFVPWQFPEPVSPTDPEINPEKAPIPDPVSKPSPVVDPETNPETQPQPIPKPQPAPLPDPNTWPDNPQIPDPPTSTGDSPPILPSFPDFPSIMPSSDVSGLIHIYNPTPGEMQAFGRWLWVTWQDATIEKMWNNPFDGIIGAMELYVTPTTGSPESIRSGFLQSTVLSKTVPVRYTTINCGSIVIPEYWKNYLDYAPYTKAYVYLPFIGIVELESDDIVGHAVNIVYHVDCYNGSCIAQITVARDGYRNTVYQYSGNCAVDVPLAGGSQAAIRAGMMQAAAYGISSVISGILGAGASKTPAGALSSLGSSIAYGASNALNSVVSAKSSVQHSGTFGASYGAMGIKRPYIIIRRPIQKVVDNYNKDYGFPAHKMVQIGTCSGFLRVREVNVISATASNEEKVMIEQLLKTGVYVT